MAPACTSMDTTNFETVNFRFHHHNHRLKENSSDPFISASCKRKSLAQCYYASHSLLSNEAACQLLEEKARPYFSLVDDRSEKCINNYADAALTLAATAGKNETLQWKSNLRSTRPISKIVERFTTCKNKCYEWKVTEEDLNVFSKSSDNTSLGFGGQKSFETKSSENSLLSFGRPKSFENANNGPSLSRSNSFTKNQDFGEGSSSWGTSDPLKSNSIPCRKVLPDAPSKPLQDQNTFEPIGRPVIGDTNNFYGFGRGVSDPTRGRGAVGFGRAAGGGTFGGWGGQGGGAHAPGPGADADFIRGNAGNARGSGWGGNCRGGFGNHGGVGRGSGFGGEPEFPENNSSRGRGSSFFSRGASNNNGSGWSRGASHGNNMNSHHQSEQGMSSSAAGFFRTARDELGVQNQRKYGSRGGGGGGGGYGQARGGPAGNAGGVQKRSLGTARRAGVNGKFVPPVKPSEEDDFGGMFGVKQPQMDGDQGEEEVDERLRNIDPKMIETIRNEIMDIGAPVSWDDIAGLEFAKTTIQEIVVWPMLRPDIFTGLRKPPKGLLLFGPPGTGKTLIGKCIASQSQSTFFSISASSLTSKWIGDGEKMVRALFAVARVHQPSVVFIDEIDSLLTQRSDTEHESSRRIKTEFLVQLDGAATGDEERILVVGATNRPQELDEAARRRLVKRLYIPLPEFTARKQIVERLMSAERCDMIEEHIDEVATLTEGYSGADMKNLCQEASLGPIRSISFSAMYQITADQVRPININDFKSALQRVRASVSNKDLHAYVEWDRTYGMGSGI